MTYHININNKATEWSDEEVTGKLGTLGNPSSNGKKTWIKDNLSTSHPGKLKQALFFILGKMNWARRAFFHIDSKQSSTILKELRTQIEHRQNNNMINLFNDAVQNAKRLNKEIDVPAISEQPLHSKNQPLPDEPEPVQSQEQDLEAKQFKSYLSGAYAKLVCYSYLQGKSNPYKQLPLKELNERSEKCRNILAYNQIDYDSEPNPNCAFISYPLTVSLRITSQPVLQENELLQVLCFMLVKGYITGFSEVNSRGILVAINEQGVHEAKCKILTKEFLLT